MAEFDDGKDPAALRTIGAVSAALGIKPHVLRYWEEQFASLRPLKRSGGRRLYRPEDVATIKRIDTLVNREGYTLKGARAALASLPTGQERTSGERAGQEAGGAVASNTAAPTDLLERLKAIRAELAAALAA